MTAIVSPATVGTVPDLRAELAKARAEIAKARAEIAKLRREQDELAKRLLAYGRPAGRRRLIFAALPVEVIMGHARAIAERAELLGRGEPPGKVFVDLIRRSVRACQGWAPTDKRVRHAVDRIALAMTPGTRGPRSSRKLLTSLAFNGLANLPGGDRYRGVRGKARSELLDVEFSDR